MKNFFPLNFEEVAKKFKEIFHSKNEEQ